MRTYRPQQRTELVTRRKPHDGTGTGERRRPKRQRHLPAEATAGYQHQPVDDRGVLQGALHRHGAAVGMAGEGYSAMAEHGQELVQPVGVVGK
jgi:hypothetical protein